MSVLVGRQAPSFTSRAVVGDRTEANFSLEQFLGESYVVLLFYPKSFTGICQTELQAYNDRLADFQARNTALVAVATDTADVLAAFRRVPRAEGGAEGVSFPLVSDANKTITTNYGVLTGEYDYNDEGQLEAPNDLVAYRATFLIDKQGQVMHQLVNHLPIGRDVDETLRVVDAVRHLQENGQACPANWRPAAVTA